MTSVKEDQLREIVAGLDFDSADDELWIERLRSLESEGIIDSDDYNYILNHVEELRELDYEVKNIVFKDGTTHKRIKINLESLYEGGDEKDTLFQEIENIFEKEATSFDYKRI